METKYIVIIQCDIAKRRCSGSACTNSFYQREGEFQRYQDKDLRYIAFTCGGCCGKAVSSHLSHLNKKLLSKNNIKKEEVVIHLSSCMTTDNYHYDRCPNIEYIKDIIRKRGYENVIEGTYISARAEAKREEGIYNKNKPE
ncbi:CGGC domain-containing protein [Alkalithermobacter paradoxus]|uniref:CGGC domain protein n=1 Tax=Alkalithermobacter paradoxus TaxID=29349 RepID=A0A1V4IB73_9FIRM|nr:CGGC domain protein [[Clostridium] thermoalcaliphilum]